MNRRELFKGLAATLAAASIPFPIEALIPLPDSQVLAYLKKVRLDLMNHIIYPPMIMHENGQIERMTTEVQVEALRHVSKLIEELQDGK